MVAMIYVCVCDCATAQCASLEVQSLSQVAQASNARTSNGMMRDERWCVQRCKETTISKLTWIDSSFGRWQLRKSVHDIEARGVVTLMQTTHLVIIMHATLTTTVFFVQLLSNAAQLPSSM
jgi:hypothetical protein